MKSKGQTDGAPSTAVDCDGKDNDVSNVVRLGFAGDEATTPNTMGGSENDSIPSSEKNDDDTTQRTELSVNSTPSKDSIGVTQSSANDDLPPSIRSDASSYTEVTTLKDELPQSVASDDLTVSNQSYIMDLTCQKQHRERERHEEAFEEALERMKRNHSKLDVNSNEYAILFLKAVAQVKSELEETYREHDRLQDQRLNEAMNAETSKRKDLVPTKPTRMESVSSAEIRTDSCCHVTVNNDISPTRPQRKESNTSVNLLQGAMPDSTEDFRPTKPPRMDSRPSSNLLPEAELACIGHERPPRPHRMEVSPSWRLHGNGNDMTPTKPARMESQASAIMLNTHPQESRNKAMTSPPKPERKDSVIPDTVHKVSPQPIRAACLRIQTSFRRYSSRKAYLGRVRKLQIDQAATRIQSQWRRCLARLFYVKRLESSRPKEVEVAYKVNIDGAYPSSKGEACDTTNEKSKRTIASKKVRSRRTEKTLEQKSLAVPCHPASPEFGTKRKEKTNDASQQEGMSTNTGGGVTSEQTKHTELKGQRNANKARSPFQSPVNRRRKTPQGTKTDPSGEHASPSIKQSISAQFSGSLPKNIDIASIVQSSRKTCRKAMPFFMPLGGKHKKNVNSPPSDSLARKRSASREKKRGSSRDGSSVFSKERSRSKSNERPRKEIAEKPKGKMRERNLLDIQNANPQYGPDLKKDAISSKKIIVKRVIRKKSDQLPEKECFSSDGTEQ